MFLKNQPVNVYVSVATSYGKTCILPQANATVLEGRMDAPQMVRLLTDKKIDLVVDATHPYAREVTENIRQACDTTAIPRIRCLREEGETNQQCILLDSIDEAVEFLEHTTGNILIATGSKELAKYTKITGCQTRCYARVLSTKPAVEASMALGFEGAHLIAMQGPFSRELNEALLRQTKAAYFVTKESGNAGGFAEKLDAAKQTGAKLLVIRRPRQTGLGLTEVCAHLEDFIKTDNCGGKESHSVIE